MNVEYFIRHVYGQPLMYPANDAARVICGIAERKTLTLAILARLESIGATCTKVMEPTT